MKKVTHFIYDFYKSNKYFLEYIFKTSQSNFSIQINCLSILQHEDFKHKKDNLSIFCYSNDCNCNGEYPCLKNYKSKEIEEFQIHRKTYISLPISLNFEVCGTITIYKSFSVNNNKLGQFIEFFKFYYQRYWIYHTSTRYLENEEKVCIIGDHLSLFNVQKKIENFANRNIPILLIGDTGTGKELWARSIHLCSNRRRNPFIPVNCAHFSNDKLAISQLFGHKKGSYTGAIYNYKGIFQQANGGIVFLDEIAELSLDVQKMLLRTLDKQEIQMVGESTPRKVNVRIISATNSDLTKEVKASKFREDLYYRIKGLQMNLAPLKERGERDITQLAS